MLSSFPDPSTVNPTWAGVDVGGRRKGFHVAAVDGSGRCFGPARAATPADVVEWLRPLAPSVVGLDCPLATAPPGRTARDGELRLARAVCGIRWTPSRERLDGNPYYAWILHGMELRDALRSRYEVIEVFPTASFTRWSGRRQGTRARWTRTALATLGLRGLPTRLNQDGRDAVAAAVTARQHASGASENYEEIIVPTAPPTWS